MTSSSITWSKYIITGVRTSGRSRNSVVSNPMTASRSKFSKRSSAWSNTQPNAPPSHHRLSRSYKLFSPVLGKFCRMVENLLSFTGIIATALTASAIARSSDGISGRAGEAIHTRTSCSQNCIRAGVGSR